MILPDEATILDLEKELKRQKETNLKLVSQLSACRTKNAELLSRWLTSAKEAESLKHTLQLLMR